MTMDRTAPDLNFVLDIVKTSVRVARRVYTTLADIPADIGIYEVATGPEQGNVYERVTAGATLTRRTDLEMRTITAPLVEQAAADHAQVTQSLADIAQSRDAADTAAANANAAANNITGSADVNLAYDSHNRILAARGVTAELANLVYTDAAKLGVVAASTGGNPAPWPALSVTGIVGGRVYDLASLGLRAGQIITVAMHAVMPSTTAKWGVYFRDAAGAVVSGDGTGQFVVNKSGEVVLMTTATIPAGATKLQVRGESLGSTETMLILAVGLTLGSLARPITPTPARNSDVVALTSRVSTNETAIGDVQAQLPTLAVERTTTVVTSGQLTNVAPTLPGTPSGNSASSQAAWGVVLQPGAVTFNLVTVQPYAAITGSKARIEVRQGTSATVLASAEVTKDIWNASVGKPLQVKLSGSVTTGAADQITVLHYAAGENTGYHQMPIDGIVLARAYISPGGNQAGAPSTGTTAGGLWVQLHNDPGATLKTYATPQPGATVDTASIKAAAQASLFGTPDVLLPRKWYVLKRANEQFNLYWKPLIRGEWYLRGIIDTTATYGRQYEKFYRLEPSSTGSAYNVPTGAFNLTVDVMDQEFAVVKSATTAVTVVDTTAQTPVRYLSIGDSITHRTQYQPQVTGLGAAVTQGIRSKGGVNYEGRGGWATNTYVTAGTAAGTDSPFMFPTDLSAANYRGNTEFWRKVIGAARRQEEPATYPAVDYAYDFDDFGRAARDGGAVGTAWAYDPATGYPLSPQTGWVVYDPTKASGARWQKWDGSAWVADATQSRTWAFDFGKYLTRYAWAFTGGNPTHVSIMLGTNDFQTTAGVTDWTGFNSRLTTMVDSIKASGAKVALVLPPISAGQDAWAVSGVPRDTEARFRRNMQDLARLILTNWDTAANETAGVYVVQAGAMVDPESGFVYASAEAVNRYDAATVTRQTDWVHPDLSGLQQLGDGIAAWVQATR